MNRSWLVGCCVFWAVLVAVMVARFERRLGLALDEQDRLRAGMLEAIIERDEALASQIRLLAQPNLSDRAGYFPDQDPHEIHDWASVWWYDVREQRVIRTRSELDRLINGPLPGGSGDLGAGYLQLLADAGAERVADRRRRILEGLDDARENPSRQR
jgi:hypothetical protein